MNTSSFGNQSRKDRECSGRSSDETGCEAWMRTQTWSVKKSKNGIRLKVLCSYNSAAMVRFALLRYLSEF